MPGRKLKLNVPAVAAVIDQRHAHERDAWRKNRLLIIKLAAHGEHTAAEIAQLCAIARGYLFKLVKTVREHGLEAVLERGKRGPKEGSRRGVTEATSQQLQDKLAAGEFVTAVDAQRWLAKEQGIERPYQTVWRWLKKAKGVLLVPRRSHSKKDPAAAQVFRDSLDAKLEALGIDT